RDARVEIHRPQLAPPPWPRVVGEPYEAIGPAERVADELLAVPGGHLPCAPGCRGEEFALPGLARRVHERCARRSPWIGEHIAQMPCQDAELLGHHFAAGDDDLPERV